MSNTVNPNIKPGSNLHYYINDFFDMVELYDDIHFGHDYKGLLKATIDTFLDFESVYTAYEVYENFLMIYQITPEDKSEVVETSPNNIISEPNILLDLVNMMKKYEENTGELINRQRDHFIHSVNVFVLGLAIYSQNENYRDIFRNYIYENREYYPKYFRDGKEPTHEEFLYRWGVAALFHDIGYPFEIIGKQIDKVIEDGVKSISVNYDVDANIDFRDFNEFNSIVKLHPYDYADNFREKYESTKILNLFKPTDIMAHKIANDFNLDETDFKLLIKHLNGFVKYMNDNGFVDHGYFSAILVLNSYGKLIQKYASKNKDFFFYPIVDSASAILLHNYYHKTLQNAPFNLGKLDPEDSPISYLLIFCDELQEWNRRPYGVIDKQKNHVNDFNVEIDNEKIIVRYILKNGSMGLGFEEKKDNLIDSVLNVRKIFPAKLSILPHVKLDNVQRDILMDELQAPDVLLRNIEKIAIEVNNQYNRTLQEKLDEAKENNDKEEIEKYETKIANSSDFQGLSSGLKMSNIRQAKSIPKKLTMIGCEIAHKTEEEMAVTTNFKDRVDEIAKNYNDDEEIIERTGKTVRILRFSEGDVEDLAIFEHDDWCNERRGNGWIYGKENDAENKINHNLVDWEDLDEATRDFDREAIRNIPNLLDSIGLKIIRSRLRSLTYKMNQFYENGKLDDSSSGEEEFKGLADHIQFSNLKQADHLVKILNNNGYELVPLYDPRDPVTRFNKEEIEHFAKRLHESWYKLKLNLNETKSKNFVDWKKLDKHVKDKNRDTIKNLPKLCADEYVGLKIIRNE